MTDSGSVGRYGPDSLFHNTLMPDELRIRTGWGEHSTTEVRLYTCLSPDHKRLLVQPSPPCH